MGRRAVIGLLVGTVLALGAGEVTAGRENRLEVQGHRGARAVRPENTLAAFRHALEVGVDVIELDLVVTRDDRLAVMHDLTINPLLCLGPDGKRPGNRTAVRSLTMDQLKGFDCGSRKHPDFPDQVPVPGERIPSLSEVFQLVSTSRLPSASTVRLNIEAKSIPSRPELAPEPRRYAELILRSVTRAGMTGRIILQSFDHRILKAMKELNPRIPVSALVGRTLPDLPRLAEGLGASVVSPNKDWITGDAVRSLHRAGVRVIPWTANHPGDWERLIELGVDGIITDDPAALIEYLEGKGLR